MKKILKFFVILVASVFVALLVAPMFYSIDEMRPKIEKSLSQQVQGEVKLSSLSFSLFPSVNLGASGVTLLPLDSNKPVATVEEVALNLPLLSFFVSPKATLELDGLKFSWIKDENGNVDNLRDFLPSAAQEGSAQVASKPTNKANNKANDNAEDESRSNGSDSVVAESEVPPGLAAALDSLPSWLRDLVLKAKFSFEVSNSELTIDWKMKDGEFVERLKEVNFGVENFGFNEAVRIYANANVEMEAEGLGVSGPVDVEGQVNFQVRDDGDILVKLQVEKTLDDLSIQTQGLLEKRPGTALTASAQGEVLVADKIDVKFPELGFKFGGISLAGMLDVTLPATSSESIILKTHIKSEEIDLSSLGVLFPLVRDFQLAGKSKVDFAAEGPLSRLVLNGKLDFNGVGGKTPALAKAISGVKGRVVIAGNSVTPLVDLKNLSLKLGRSDLAMTATVAGARPTVTFDVRSKMLDIDELLETYAANSSLATRSPGEKSASTQADSASGNKAKSNMPLDASLTAMAPEIEAALANETLDKLFVKGKVTFEKISVMGALYEDASFEALLKDRKFGVQTSSMKAYGGKMTASMDMGLVPGRLSYAMDASLKGIQVERALASHAPKWKEDVQGSLVGSFKLSGVGLSKKDLEKNLKGSLKGSLKNGVLDIPVLKVLNDSIAKLPGDLKGSTQKKLDGQNFNGSFKTAKVNTAIVGRELRLKKLDVLYDTQKGNLGDMRFKSTGKVDFDQNIDLVSTLFVTQKVINIGELKGKSGFVEVPLKMKGTLENPTVDSGYTAGILGKRLAKNSAKKAIKKVAPKVADQIKKKVPQKHKKKVDDLLKKIGF